MMGIDVARVNTRSDIDIECSGMDSDITILYVSSDAKIISYYTYDV